MEITLTGTDEHAQQVIVKAHQVFSDKLDIEQFSQSLESLRNLKWNFVRACLLFQQAIKCKNCNRNVALAILCSAVESMSSGYHTTIFKDWLIENKLRDLSEKSEGEIRTTLNRAYQEYVNFEDEREGASYNFRRFLLENCPQELKQGPIKIHAKCVGFVQASFEDSLRYIYAKFRSFFLHRGIGRVSLDLPPCNEDMLYMIVSMLDKFGREYYSVELTEVLDWFENVVKESLYHFLTKSHTI